MNNSDKNEVLGRLFLKLNELDKLIENNAEDFVSNLENLSDPCFRRNIEGSYDSYYVKHKNLSSFRSFVAYCHELVRSDLASSKE